MTEAERLATRLQERYEFRVELNSAIMDPFEAPPDPRDEELRDAATELRRLQGEVEALRSLLLEADRIAGHDDAWTEWREKCAVVSPSQSGLGNDQVRLPQDATPS